MLLAKSISSTLDKIRKTVRSFRKSSVARAHLKNAFQSSSNFKHPLRPVLDVKTRWGSSSAMFQQFVIIENILVRCTSINSPWAIYQCERSSRCADTCRRHHGGGFDYFSLGYWRCDTTYWNAANTYYPMCWNIYCKYHLQIRWSRQ